MTTTLLPQYLIETLGWTLIHWLWQGLAIAVVLAVILKAFAKVSANKKYLIACIALIAMVVTPMLSFKVLSNSWQMPVKPVEEFDLSDTSQLATIEMPVVENIVPVTEEPQTQPVVKITFKQKFCNVIENNASIIVYSWFIGVFGLSLWHLGGWRQLQKLRRTMVKPVGKELVDKMNKLANAIGVKRAVALAESALVAGPIVVGWLKPIILLPASALTGLDSEQLQAILAHELAHIKRCDYLVNIIQTAIEIIGFYNPAIWWVSAKIRAERENCCDDIAVAVTGDKFNYAKTLTDMEELRCGYKLAVAGSGGSLFDRVKRLLAKDKDISGEKSLLTAAIAVLLLAMVAIPACFAMSSKADEKADSASKVDTSDYKIVLDSGVTVELVGICDYPSAGKKWWTPDGKLLENKIITKAFSDYKSTYPSYEIAFKIEGKDYSLAMPRIGKPKGVNHINVVSPQGLVAWRVHTEPNLKKTNIQVGVATGQWKTLGYHNGYGTTSKDVGRKRIIFSQANETNDGVLMTVSDDIVDYDNATRLIAIDKKGVQHGGKAQTSLSVNKLRQQGFVFPEFSLKDIKEFQFQARPYEWVEFKNVSLKPDKVVVYPVNKKVSDFPEAEDFSTPESAYAAINRVMAADDWQGWQRVSTKKVAERLAKWHPKKEKKVDPEESRVVLNAKILEIRIKDDHAVVIAEFPQELSSKPIKEPIDYRHLVFEDDKWLNTGQNRYDTIDQAREKFDNIIEKQSAEEAEQLKIEQKYTEVIENPDMLLNLTEGLFEEIRKADYEKILSYYNEKTGKWKRDGWKKFFSDVDYMTNTNLPGLAKWTCENFKTNPIVSVELGKVYESKKKFSWTDKNTWPTVPYKLVLQDGGILEGDLLFQYIPERKRSMLRTQKAYWQPMLGIDWHLQDHPIKRGDTKIDIKPTDFKLKYDPKQHAYSLSVKIKNEGNVVIPKFKLRYYRGNPKANLDETGNEYTNSFMITVGPIEPQKEWSEGSRGFGLPDGECEFTVVLDYDNEIAETDENNNTISIKVVIKDGRIVEVEAADTLADQQLLKPMFTEAQLNVLSLQEACQQENWSAVNDIAERIRDIFRDLEDAVDYWRKDKNRPDNLIGQSLGRVVPESQISKLHFIVLDITKLSDELHDSIRDSKHELVEGYYTRLILQWQNLTKIQGISQLIEKTDSTQEAVNKTVLHDSKITSAFHEFIRAVRENDNEKLQEFANRQLKSFNLDESEKGDLIKTLEFDAQALRRYKGIENLTIYKIQKKKGRNEIWTSEVIDPRGIAGRLCIGVFGNEKAVLEGISFIDNNGRRLALRPQILTTARILSVPTDLPQLEDILSDDKSKPIMIMPKKLEDFFKAINITVEARSLSAPKMLANDGEVGQIRTKNVEGFESVKLSIKNTVQPDRKTVVLESDFKYTMKVADDYKTNNVKTKATLLSDYAIAVDGGIDERGNKIVLIIQPKVLEAGNSETGGVKDPIQLRKESMVKLRKLATSFQLYASDNDDGYPDSLEQVRRYFVDEDVFEWLIDNVEYLAKGRKITISPDETVAYDKTMLAGGAGGSVALFNDMHVEFKKKDFFKKPEPDEAENSKTGIVDNKSNSVSPETKAVAGIVKGWFEAAAYNDKVMLEPVYVKGSYKNIGNDLKTYQALKHFGAEWSNTVPMVVMTDDEKASVVYQAYVEHLDAFFMSIFSLQKTNGDWKISQFTMDTFSKELPRFYFYWKSKYPDGYIRFDESISDWVKIPQSEDEKVTLNDL